MDKADGLLFVVVVFVRVEAVDEVLSGAGMLLVPVAVDGVCLRPL